MASLSTDDILVLEHTRQRLAQLTSSLDILRNQILTSDPLPPWPTIHAQCQLLATHLKSVAEHLKENPAPFSSTIAYPVPSYPGREQEALLNQVLRKKLEPGVEARVDQAEGVGRDVVGMGGEVKIKEWRMFWQWCVLESNKIGHNIDWGVDPEESESEEEEEEGEGMEGVGKGKEVDKGRPLTMEQILRFMHKGEEPRG